MESLQIKQTEQTKQLAEVVEINTKFLGIKDLEDLCKTLAKSQGFYGRLLANLQELDKEQRKELNTQIKKQRFTDTLDLILWLES